MWSSMRGLFTATDSDSLPHPAQSREVRPPATDTKLYHYLFGTPPLPGGLLFPSASFPPPADRMHDAPQLGGPWRGKGRYDRHASETAVSARSKKSMSFSKSGCPGINAKIASRRSSGSLSSASKIDAGSQSLHRDIQEPLFDATRHFWRFGCCSQASSSWRNLHSRLSSVMVILAERTCSIMCA